MFFNTFFPEKHNFLGYCKKNSLNSIDTSIPSQVRNMSSYMESCMICHPIIPICAD